MIEYQSDGSWQRAGEITFDKEVSNALNGGYFLYALPVFEDWQDLENLKIKFTYSTNQELLSNKKPAFEADSSESRDNPIVLGLSPTSIIADQDILSSPPGDFKGWTRGELHPGDSRRQPEDRYYTPPTAHSSYQIINEDSNKIIQKIIQWQVDWKMGESYELKYQFDAPDISPYLYLLGPLEFYEY